MLREGAWRTVKHRRGEICINRVSDQRKIRSLSESLNQRTFIPYDSGDETIRLMLIRDGDVWVDRSRRRPFRVRFAMFALTSA
jgi:hypothetical protein